jgi:hypothetical protein
VTSDDYEPIRVRMVADDTSGRTARPSRRAMTANTFTLTAANPVQRAFPRSDNRVQGWITSAAAAGTQLAEPAEPAAGASYTYTVTAPCQLLSAGFQLVTSATAGNRVPLVIITDAGGNTLAYAKQATAVAASSTILIYAFQGASLVSSATGSATFALPQNFILQPGYQVVVTVNGILAGDQISQIALAFAPQAPAVYVAGNFADAAAQGGGCAQVSGTDTMPFPVDTTGEVWISAPAASLPVTVSAVAVYQEPG